MSTDTVLPTIVLVHGAWVDGSAWAGVILELERKGYPVLAAPIPLSSLSDDTSALQGVLERTEGKVILVGHAYAGAVISSIKDERVVALVYVAGLAPDAGQSVGDVFFMNPPHAKAPDLKPDADGRFWLARETFAEAFAQHATKDQLTVLAAVQRPIHGAAIAESVDAPLWRKRPSWYLLAQEDRMIPVATQRFVAERMGATVHQATVDHCPMLTAVPEVVGVVLAAARAVSGP